MVENWGPIFGMAVPLILASVEVAKRTGLPSKYAALLSVLVGMVWGIILRSAGIALDLGDGSVIVAAGVGAIAGLSAAGVYSGTKATTKQ